jgi:predicted short-subunit dehydrogenase-like oxidoreductase (DUF2520 family)
MNFNMIGAGRLGKNLARALCTAQLANLNSIYNRSMQSAEQACKDIGVGTAVDLLTKLPPVDMTWITTNDDTIEFIVSELAKNSLLKPGGFIVHCSGALNSKLLNPLKAQGCYVASLHPLKAFKSGYLEDNAFNEIDCILEGDWECCHWLKSTFELLGSRVTTINPNAKAIYHAAATIASNYLITLAASSEELLLQSGVAPEQARSMVCNLMQGNITNLRHTQCITHSLTGPLMRGDIKTIALHIRAIENPTLANLYKAAGLATLPFTTLEEDKKIELREMLKLGVISN